MSRLKHLKHGKHLKHLKHLRLGSRLGLGFAIVLALLVLMIIVANVRFQRVSVASADVIERDWVQADAAATIDARARANARRVLELFFLSDDAQIEKVHQDIEAHDRNIGAALETLDRQVDSGAGKALIGGESVEKVEAGSRLVDDAGRGMQDIVTQVKRVNDLIAEISSASVEQSGGISLIGAAVAQLDRVTQQNAALVEESAAAAASLKQQAANLAQVVGVFRLGAEVVAASVAPISRAPGIERRGPTRATNVTRPQFGDRDGGAAVDARRASGADMESVESMASAATLPDHEASHGVARTGTDGWVC